MPPEEATVGVPFHDDDDDDHDDIDDDDNDGGALFDHHPLSVCQCDLDGQLEKFSHNQ